MGEISKSQQDELNEIIERSKQEREAMIKAPIVDTHRTKTELHCIPPDMDFTMKDGNTEYEVVGHFNSKSDEYLINKIIRQLGYSFNDE